MKVSLYFKFLFTYIIFGIASFISIATLSTRLTHNYLISQRSSILYDEAHLIASTYSSIYANGEVETASTLTQLKAVSTFLRSEVWIVSRSGEIIIDSGETKAGSSIENFDPTIAGTKSYMQGSFFGIFSQDVLSVIAPITGNYRPYGYVIIHLPISKVMENQYKILNIVYITSAIIFTLSLFILMIFQTVVYRPIKKITEAAKQYAQRNLHYRVNLHTNDEIGYLADTLNFMAEELSNTEEYQRQFITNISHDFRSPLTSIKGYLEAILDGTIPESMMNKYLQRVIGETERLAKLTESILTLKDLDRKGYLFRSNFDINRVIKSTASSFEMQCSSKNILINLNFIDNKTMVHADIGKIERVLYNLIDNAIKFSHENSEIEVNTRLSRGKIFVSVKDTGVGIDSKDIGKIFDRFYKSDQSRGKDKKGTGLGLSIVKDIMQAHGENIDVISTPDVGTEFIFSLPLVNELEE